MDTAKKFSQRFGISIIFVIGMMLQYPLASSGATFYAILAGDTNDRTIGKGVTADIKNIWELINKIDQNVGWTTSSNASVLVTKPVLNGAFKETDLTGENLTAAIEGLSVGEDDVIFFYYSGHGRGDESGKTKWPYLVFNNQKDSVAYDKIFTMLKAKGARLLIILTDCCNNFSDWQESDQYGSKATKKAIQIPENYQKLFLKQRGYILATSSQPTEVSSASSAGSGSLFTYDFLQKLERELLSNNPTWDNIKSDELKIENQSMVFVQHPQYSIDVKPITGQPGPPAPVVTVPEPEPTPTATPEISSEEPDAKDACITWQFENDTPYQVYLEFYSQDRNKVWPEGYRFLFEANDPDTLTHKTCGNPGETICYGAWTVNGDLSWGTGQDNTYSCQDCCAVSEGVTEDLIRFTE